MESPRFSRFSVLEVLAVIFSICYTVLITYGNVLCWSAAILSASLYIYICVQKRLFAETFLQCFYLCMAAYGWYHWGQDQQVNSDWTLTSHLPLIGAGILITLLSGYLLKRYSIAALPFTDSFTTVFSMLATVLMVQLVLENWLYWIVIDSVAVYLYYKRQLKLTALLFVAYTLLAINGYFQWL